MEVRDAASSNNGICYVVLVFNNITELFCCLWSTWSDDNTYVLCVDAKSSRECRQFCEILAECFDNILSAGTHVGSWGGYSLVHATLRGIQAALNCNEGWQHLCLLSGNHVALISPSEILAGLEPGKSYLRSEGVPKVSRPTHETFLSQPGIHRRLWGRFEEIPGVRSVMTEIRDELPEVPFFKGSQWVVLSRSACQSLFRPPVSVLSHFFEHSFVPDETYFHTLVRLAEGLENVRSLETTSDRWNGGRAVYLTSEAYLFAAKSGRMFARKLPASLDQNFIETIARQCSCMDIRDFANRVNDNAKAGQVEVSLNSDGLCIELAEEIDEQIVEFEKACETALVVLRECLVDAVITVEIQRGRLEVLIEPSAAVSGMCPVIGIARSGDGDSLWCTIQLRSTWFSDELAASLMASPVLKGLLDPTFEETHMEPRFREFFQRELRTAYIIKMEEIESSRERLKLRHFALLLANAWDCSSQNG